MKASILWRNKFRTLLIAAILLLLALSIFSTRQGCQPSTEHLPRNAIVVYGDCRSGHRVHDSIVRTILKTDPVALFHTGDLVNDGASSGDWATFNGITAELVQSTPFYPALKKMPPIQIEQEYRITYLHSYGQDSPWFAALTNKRLLACRDPERGYTYANPRGHDMYSGAETRWVEITNLPAKVHAFTVCYFGSEEFLPDCPFVLALIEFEGVNTLLLTRLKGVDPGTPSLDCIGMQVRPHFLRNSKLKPTDVYFSPG